MSSVNMAGFSRRRRVLVTAAIGLCVSLVVSGLALLQLAPVSTLDRALLDQFARKFGSGRPAASTVFVDIDDVSLSAIGQWPWPRYRVASLVRRIAADAPSALALDILFPDPDRVSLSVLRDTFSNDFGLDISFNGVPSGLLDNDGYLGREIARSGAVGSRYFYFDHVNTQRAVVPVGLRVGGKVERLRPPSATGVLENVAPILAQTSATGFVNSRTDDDGVLRELPLLIEFQGAVHPSLALAAAMRALGVTEANVETDAHGLVLRIGTHRIPIDEAGQAMLRFNGAPALYPRVTALDLLNGKVAEGTFRDKIVFVGTSAIGLRDHHPTAVDPRFPGTQVHAVMVDNILHDTHLRQPSWQSAAVVGACVAVGALLAAIVLLGNGIAPLAIGSVVLAVAALTASALLHRWGLVVPPGAPLLVIGALFVVLLALDHALERRRALRFQRELENSRQVTIESMAAVAETRDPETGAHIKRTQHYVRAIAQELRRSSPYADMLTTDYIELLFISAPLHDIGKVGVPDHILLKPGRLDAAEMALMKHHAEYGRQIIAGPAQHIVGENFLTIAGEIAATHHEKWDGTGYPLGLAGQDIPLSGRIMAVADVYDALISRRCYKEPYPHSLATSLMQDGRGATFDPEVLAAFFRIEDEIRAIAERYRDEDASPRPDAAAVVAQAVDDAARRAAAPAAADHAPH